MRYVIDEKGVFIYQEHNETINIPRWTAERPMQPAYTPAYVDWTFDAATGECTGGHWVDLNAPTEEQLQSMAAESLAATYVLALEEQFELEVRAKGYDSRITCTMRAGYSGPFQAEGIAFAAWMDNCYMYVFEQSKLVASGARTIPTTEGMLAELPKLVWP